MIDFGLFEFIFNRGGAEMRLVTAVIFKPPPPPPQDSNILLG